MSVSTAAAATCDDEPQVCAKQAFEAGIAAYQADRYEEALKHFRAAQQLRPHPVVLFNVALAEARTGLVLEALEHLDQVYNDPDTPEKLLGKVRAERDAAARQVARVSLTEPGADLIVDGRLAEGSPPSVDVNPGDHEVKLVVDGNEIEQRTISLAVGERLQLVVPKSAAPRPAPPPAAPPPARPPPASSPPTSSEVESSRGVSPGWFYGGAALTAALGGATTWSGLDTRRAFHDYEDDVDGLTPEQRQARVDSGQAKQRRTNVLVGATVTVGLATVATALFLVDWSGPRNNSSLAVGPASLRYRVRF